MQHKGESQEDKWEKSERKMRFWFFKKKSVENNSITQIKIRQMQKEFVVRLLSNIDPVNQEAGPWCLKTPDQENKPKNLLIISTVSKGAKKQWLRAGIQWDQSRKSPRSKELNMKTLRHLEPQQIRKSFFMIHYNQHLGDTKRSCNNKIYNGKLPTHL